METLYPRIRTHDSGLLWPQKLDVLLNCSEIEWSTSEMVAMLYLSGFDIKLIHLPGMKMVQSDTLSGWPDYRTEGQFDDEKKTVLSENLFINLLDTEGYWMERKLT
jgi:hypothetical protein